MGIIGTLHLPPAESTIAPAYDSLFYFILWLSAFFFAIITIGTIAFAIAYRRKKGEAIRLTPGFGHNTALELVWSIIPTILFFVIFVWGFRLYMRYSVIPGNAMEIRVNAYQWGWNFVYPEGVKSNALVVPEDKPIKLIMSSQDVIHSLFIPDFRVKMDILPNRYTSMWFTASNIGDYDLFCTEYCGQKHSRMYAQVNVKSETEYHKWIEENSVPPTGEVLYKRNNCYTCHSIDGTPNNGPSFKNLYGKTETLTDGTTVVVDDNYIRQSILEPQAKIVKGFENVPMTSFQGLLDSGELDLIIDYIKSLKDE